MTTRDIVLTEIQRVAANQNVTLAPLTDDLPLAASGLDFLCFAMLIAHLEDLTGLDPLGETATFPRTIGEFVALYEQVVV